MKEFYRISNWETEMLYNYMDSHVKEHVHFIYESCTNDEFVYQVFLRMGISMENIKIAINIDIDEIEQTCWMINLIKTYMAINNRLNYFKLKDPKTDFLTDNTTEGREYRLYLDEFVECLNVMRGLMQDKIPGLTDLKGNFPEIGYTFIEGYLIYKWDGVVI